MPLLWLLLCTLFVLPSLGSEQETEWEEEAEWVAMFNNTIIPCPFNCSNHGQCDNTTGECKCDDDRTGAGCQYRTFAHSASIDFSEVISNLEPNKTQSVQLASDYWQFYKLNIVSFPATVVVVCSTNFPSSLVDECHQNRRQWHS